MKKYFKIFLMLITSLLLTSLVNASSIIMISSKYETKIKCDEMKKKNTDDNKITVKYSRSECYFKKGKYVYNVCEEGTVCPTGDNDKNYSSQQSNSNNEDIPYKGVLDELLRVIKIKKAEKNDTDYEKFLNEAIDYVNGLEKKYENNPDTKAMVFYLKTSLIKIKSEFDKHKNKKDVYSLLCDLGSCDKNNFVTTNITTSTGTTSTGATTTYPEYDRRNYVLSKNDPKCKNLNYQNVCYKENYGNKCDYKFESLDYKSIYTFDLYSYKDPDSRSKTNASCGSECVGKQYLNPKENIASVVYTNTYKKERGQYRKLDGGWGIYSGKIFVPPYIKKSEITIGILNDGVADDPCEGDFFNIWNGTKKRTSYSGHVALTEPGWWYFDYYVNESDANCQVSSFVSSYVKFTQDFIYYQDKDDYNTDYSEKCKNWFNNMKWESNGDPVYNCQYEF